MMAMELVGGEIVKEFWKQLYDVSMKTYKCKGIAKDLAVTIANIQPNICREIHCTGDESSSYHDVQMRKFFETLEKGKELTEEILKSNPCNFISQLKYVGKMENLQKEIDKFLRGPLLTGISANVNHLQVTFEVRFDEFAMKLDELSRQLAATDIKRNERVGEKMKATEMFTDTELGFLRVGLEFGKKKVINVLLKSMGEGGLIGISGMCGSGTYSLVKELLGDDEVQDHFQVLLVTVSQSPDLKDLRVRISEFLTGSEVGGGPCLGESIVQSEHGIQKWKLVILDDVWTMESLDQLMFKIPESTTLVVLQFKLVDPGNTYNVEEETAETKEGTAFTTLIDLSEKNLLTLVKELSAMHTGYDDKFVMPTRGEHVLPRERERNNDEPYNAQIVSNHTVSTLMAPKLFIEETMTEFMTLLDAVSKKAYWCKGIAQHLCMVIADIQPTIKEIQEIQYTGVELCQHHHVQMCMFFDTLVKGKKLTEKILKCNRRNMIGQGYYVRKMKDLQKKINVFLRGPLFTIILTNVHRLRTTAEVGFHQVDRSFERVSEQLASLKLRGCSSLRVSEQLASVKLRGCSFLRGPFLTGILADVHHLRATAEVRFDRVDRSFERLSEQLGSMKIRGCALVREAIKTTEMVTNVKGSVGTSNSAKCIAENLGMVITYIQWTRFELPPHHAIQMRIFFKILGKGKKLTEKILKCNQWNMFHQLHNVRNMENLRKKINVFLRGPFLTSILDDVQHLRITFEVYFDRVDRSFEKLSEQICSMKNMEGELVR